MSLPKTERNQALYNDSKTGLSVVDLVAKYRIDSSVVTRIINREKNKERLLDVMPSLENEETI